ncbi:MAG: immunity 26/phosphotriesterase HocA family protein [Acidimicrobiales bacterium]
MSAPIVQSRWPESVATRHYPAVGSEPTINFVRQRKGGRRPTAGDLFSMQLESKRFLFGRVVDGPLPTGRAPMPGAYLVYVYRDEHRDPEPDQGRLTPENLLVPPAFINQLGWTKGYFISVANRPVLPHDRLRQHCFARFNGTFLDENGSLLDGPSEPCGEWGLGNHRTLDDAVSDALGVPRAPDPA